MDETLNRKLRVLADAAKYDASCASSGATTRKTRQGGIGSTDGNGTEPTASTCASVSLRGPNR